MMTLGPVAFSVATTAFQRLRRVTAFRWPVLERVGRGRRGSSPGPVSSGAVRRPHVAHPRGLG